jgi:hypothetical protein
VATSGGVRSAVYETPVVDAATQWLTTAHRAVERNSVGGYVNYVEPEIPEARYFAGNLVRLTAVRDTYDPDGLMYSGIA